jgi:demethylmenaquinone methyltransferase/2-methoxy-6-polyprenyl-1,4-benzoquinol methylase
MTVWYEVENALDKIIEDYEKVNHVISLFQDDKNRRKGLGMIGEIEGAALELGCGPGNYSRMIKTIHNGTLVCLDFSKNMLRVARHRNMLLHLSYVRGVFEALPFRDETFQFVTAAFALRDTLDKPKAFHEASSVLTLGGKFLLIDIGKPDNRIIQGFMGVFMRFIVPIMGGLTAGYGHRNPWSILYRTYKLLPSNNDLKNIISKNIMLVRTSEDLLGGLLITVAHKVNR